MKTRWHRHKKLVYIGLALAVIVTSLAVVTFFISQQSSAPNISDTPKDGTVDTETPPADPEPGFDKTRHSTSAANSIWVVINKRHPLSPLDYTPSDLMTGRDGYIYSSRIDQAINQLLDTAAGDGLTLQISSAYRSYANQVTLYNNYVAQYGQATADTISARPGFSEHQTGLTLDIGGITNPNCNFNVCFGDTPEGRWLAEHAVEYGFIVRYTKENSSITGYSPEPWHIRYIGRELAAELKKQNITSLEEFFDISGGTEYIR